MTLRTKRSHCARGNRRASTTEKVRGSTASGAITLEPTEPQPCPREIAKGQGGGPLRRPSLEMATVMGSLGSCPGLHRSLGRCPPSLPFSCIQHRNTSQKKMREFCAFRQLRDQWLWYCSEGPGRVKRGGTKEVTLTLPSPPRHTQPGPTNSPSVRCSDRLSNTPPGTKAAKEGGIHTYPDQDKQGWPPCCPDPGTCDPCLGF